VGHGRVVGFQLILSKPARSVHVGRPKITIRAQVHP
jgi:hypothetical protein